MSLRKALSPKDTEEIKPNLFIQKRGKDNYRKVEPLVWNGKWRIKQQFGWKNLFTIVIVLFLAWSYFNETSYCRELQENPCELIPELITYCSQFNSFGDTDIQNERGYYNLTIQSNP